MPTENEIRVIKILSAIEIPPVAAEKIESWGTEAVTVVVEAALGVYPGLRPKVRTNAVALLGQLDHPQAAEAIPMLVTDPNPDVAIRAMRAAGEQKAEAAVDGIALALSRADSSPILAAEALKALLAIRSPKAQAAVASYETTSPSKYPHRASRVVDDVILRRRTS